MRGLGYSRLARLQRGDNGASHRTRINERVTAFTHARNIRSVERSLPVPLLCDIQRLQLSPSECPFVTGHGCKYFSLKQITHVAVT